MRPIATFMRSWRRNRPAPEMQRHSLSGSVPSPRPRQATRVDVTGLLGGKLLLVLRTREAPLCGSLPERAENESEPGPRLVDQQRWLVRAEDHGSASKPDRSETAMLRPAISAPRETALQTPRTRFIPSRILFATNAGAGTASPPPIRRPHSPQPMGWTQGRSSGWSGVLGRDQFDLGEAGGIASPIPCQ